jgi:hypothetical protein
MAEVKNICLEALERYCSTGATGRLDLSRGPFEGQIYTEGTFIVHAKIADLEGVPALFRLFDWGDAETIWQAGLAPDHPSLHLHMDAAIILYAENLQDRAEIESRGRDRPDEAIVSPELVAGQAGGVESVLKHYTISLECSDPTLLPNGFTFTDSTKSSYVIGSSDECDVVLRHPSVDPLHCGVILEKGSVTIWDLGSQAGVKINGAPVSEDKLKVGDLMTLGDLDIQVRFQLRRPNIRRAPETVKLPLSTTTLPMPKLGPPTKEIPKGPITYDKVSRQLAGNDKANPFLKKLGSLFGGKDRK